ncbi:MAG: SPOR domain-containing protein [Tenuifilaceae bacterium]|jgi:hypothetical protein|nr:SPOR domain-containing protein [Tenuifilaceae bacterium]
MFRVAKNSISKGIIVAFLVSSGICVGYSQDGTGIIGQLQQFNPEKGNISIKQDTKVEQLLNAYYLQNASKPGMQGFRIRIFFDPGQTSRTRSLEVMNEFMEGFPGMSIYRTFDSPYYKVSVGDFRTRDEAIRMLSKLNRKYPKAFIVPEWINFPRID